MYLQKIGENVHAKDVEPETESAFDVFKYPQLRKKLFIVTLNW